MLIPLWDFSLDFHLYCSFVIGRMQNLKYLGSHLRLEFFWQKWKNHIINKTIFILYFFTIIWTIQTISKELFKRQQKCCLLKVKYRCDVIMWIEWYILYKLTLRRYKISYEYFFVGRFRFSLLKKKRKNFIFQLYDKFNTACSKFMRKHKNFRWLSLL